MHTILSNHEIINSRRQAPNLKKLLTKAKFSEMEEPQKKVTKCLRPNCGVCVHLIEGHQYTFRCGKTFIVKSDISCLAQNIIYSLICRGCSKEYIGQSSNLRKRMTVHRQQISHEEVRLLKVSKHIDECSTLEPKFLVFPLMKTDSNATIRREKEEMLIKMLKPELNSINH